MILLNKVILGGFRSPVLEIEFVGAKPHDHVYDYPDQGFEAGFVVGFRDDIQRNWIDVIHQLLDTKVGAARVLCVVRPLDDSHFDFLAHRHGHIREFAPAFLQAFTFRSNPNPDPLLQAVELLRTLNQERRRAVPEDAPLKFIPATWHPYVVDRSGRINRRYYELCTLWELRAALRAGDV